MSGGLRAKRGVVALAITALTTSSALVVVNPASVAADEAADAAGIKAGLSVMAKSLTGIDSLGDLAGPIPFSFLLPSDPLGVEAALDDLATKIAASAASNIAELEDFLNDPDDANGTDDDGTFAGATLDVTADISTADSPFTVQFGVSLTRPAFDEPFSVPGNVPGLSAAGTYSVALEASINVTARFDPGPVPGEFWIESLNGSLSFDASADLSAAGDPITVGILEAELNGTAAAAATFDISINDPDGDGRITVTELVTTIPADLFDADFGTSSADLDLTITSSLSGLAGATGTITLHDTDLSNGLDTPQFDLQTFNDFRNMSALDLLSALAQVAASLGALQSSGLADIDLPFVDKDLSELFDLATPIGDFLVANGLTSASDPLSIGSAPGFVSALPNLDTIGELASLLEAAFPSLGSSLVATDIVDYIPATKRLTFDLGLSDPGTTYPLVPNLSDQVASLGIASVDPGASSASANVSYDLGLQFGVDLSPPAPGSVIGDRAFIVTDGVELSLDAPVSAELDMTGLIGFVGVSLTDTNNSGPVQIVARKNTSNPMLSVDLDDGPNNDGVLTVTELFDLLEAGNLGALGSVDLNVKVPQFGVQADVKLNNTTVASGVVTVEWADFPNGTPTVAANGNFNDQLLDFAFDASNPLELFTQILDAVELIVQQLDALAGSNGTLTGVLPFASTSFDQLANKFGEIKAGIDSVIGDPAATLQLLERKLELAIGDALGISEAASGGLLTFEIDKTTNPSAPAVIGHLDLGICSAPGTGCTLVQPLSKPFSVDLGLSNIVGVSGGGAVAVNYAAIIDLDFGVQLPEVTAGFPPVPSGLPQPFVLDTSSVSLDVGIDATTTLSAKLGPVTVGLGAAGDPATFKLAAGFSIANPDYGGAGVHRVPLNDIGTFLSSAVDTDISASTQVTCPGGPLVDACAVLPVYLGTTDLGDITFNAPDLLNPAGWSVNGLEDVLNQLVAEAFDWTNLLQGLQLVLDQIEAATNGQSFGAEIPVLGDALDAGADIANTFNTEVVTPLNALISQLQNELSLTTIEDEIDQFFESNLGSLLVDQGNNGNIEDDVQVTFLCGEPAAICGGAHDLTDVVDVQIAFSLGDTADYPIVFDFGFPGLRLAVKDDPNVAGDELVANVGWRIDLAFGISRTQGFYLRTDNPLRPGSGEMTVTPGIDLPNEMFGDLAFIPVSLKDVHGGNDIGFTLAADITGGGADNKLSLADLIGGLDPGTGIVITIDGNIDLQLDLATGLSPSDVQNFGNDAPSLPVFKAQFNLGWDFSAGAGTNIEAFAQSNDFTIEFKNVRIDLGSLLGDFLKEILGELDRFVRPLKPVLDILNAPIPGIQQLAEFFNQPPPTMLDLIDAQNGPDSTVLIRRLIMLVNFITAVNGSGAQNPEFPLGDFDLKSDVVRAGPLSATEAKKLLGNLPSEIAKPLEALAGPILAELNTAKDQGGFTFPAFDEPTMLFQMLVGQDVDLIRFDAGKLEAKFEKTFKFGPPIGIFPVSVGATVAFSVKGHLEVGYDTRGIRNAVKVLTDDDPNNDGFFDTVATLFQGVFFDDLKDGVDVPEIALLGRVSVQAALDVLVAEAGIRGGVQATLDLNLHDGGPANPPPPENLDGKLRIEEIIQFLAGNPLCLFDAGGKFTAFVELYVDTILTSEETWTLVDATIADYDGLFDDICERNPVLASFVDPDNHPGVLVLHVGPYAHLRNYDEDNPDEKMTVRQTGPGKVTVDGFGLSQDYEGVTRIFGAGAGGQDSLIMQAGGTASIGGDGNLVSTVTDFTIPVDLCGGPGDDQLTGGNAADTIVGDGGEAAGFRCTTTEAATDGADTINGGGGNDTLWGLGGIDTVNGDAGDDTADGGSGNDRVVGFTGNDTLRGGPDAKPGGTTDVDTMLGGDGNDTLYGGDDGDQIFGGNGDDDAFGGPGNDQIAGEAGADELSGEAGHDVLLGGTENDTLHGGTGDDDAFGEAGDDTINGNEDNDDLLGGPGNDTINGGSGRDYALGDDGTINRPAGQANASSVSVGTGATGNDTINGDADPDVLYGGNGADTMNGGDGDDEMYGNAGADTMNGNGDDDNMFGGPDNDLMHGDDGDDTMRGEQGNDEMYGDADEDTMFGDSGTDEMYGNGAHDVVRGGIDDDYIEGNDGADDLFGDGAHDDIIGGTSQAGTPDDGDNIEGNEGADVIVGDNGTITRPGGNFDDDPGTVRRNTTVFDVGDNSIGGGDTIDGGPANDRIWGGNGADQINGGTGDDLIEGNDDSDTVAGGQGNDRIAGGSGARATLVESDGTTEVDYDHAPDVGDILSGNEGDDVITGDNATISWIGLVEMTAFADTNVFGDDEIHGNAGQDRLYGQLGGDTITGDQNEDYAVGDLGFITPGAPHGFWPSGAPIYDVNLELAPDLGGADDIDGGTGDDHLFGGAAADVIQGQAGDDYIEGNGGQDEIYGWAPDAVGDDPDQDDLIGGSSSWTRPNDDSRADVGEVLMQGNPDHDVMAGDNADIDRIVDPNDSTKWAPDEVIAGARKRVVTLLDREKTGAALQAVSGGDIMVGNDGSDRMFGEGGADSVKGNAHDDLIEGNQDGDWLEGNAGEDDIVGGSSFLASADGAPLAGAGPDLGDPDAGDAIFGGAGADVIAGDNAVIIRRTAGNSVAYDAALQSAYFSSDHEDDVPGWWLGVSTDRLVTLLDRTTLNAGRFGDDLISAGSGEDVAFGQDGEDWISGAGDDDAIEGNGADDKLFGDRTPDLDDHTSGEPVFGPQLTALQAIGSDPLDRDGAPTPAGEDDIVGGSNVAHRDGHDVVEGDAEDDFILGDNGTLRRHIVDDAYVPYPGVDQDRWMRRATRHHVGAVDASIFGDDLLRGNAGDDAIWGQEGDDDIRGQADDDDLFGELGDDTIYGGTGEDAMVGDRGSVTNTVLGNAGALFSEPVYSASFNGPPFVDVTLFRTGTYDRRVDLAIELPGSVGGPFPGQSAAAIVANGLTTGGADTMRGGPDHDSLHGAFGDDIMNGDSGGDILFGDDGSDVMWGGRGSNELAEVNDRGANDSLVDYVFGGHGGDPNTGAGVVTGGADIIDYLPRVGVDPAEWHAAIGPYTDGAGGGETVRQHHQGIDWIYGGWDRDVMEANVADNGPNPGDRLWDWTGAYNLYVHCPAAYGGYNDQRSISPQMILFLERLAYGMGVGTSLSNVQSSTSSAYRELALVYQKDVQQNNGRNYPTTPGHFEDPAACTDD